MFNDNNTTALAASLKEYSNFVDKIGGLSALFIDESEAGGSGEPVGWQGVFSSEEIATGDLRRLIALVPQQWLVLLVSADED